MTEKNNGHKQKRAWYRLDTAALIFPATMNRKWSNAFRLSALMDEDVIPDLLQQAVDDLRERFPSFYVCLNRGFFWYYLRESKQRVIVRSDYAYPLVHMNRTELSNNCLRVIYYKNRISVEFFHSLTDGRGGSIYLCTLIARYLQLMYDLDYVANPAFPNPLGHVIQSELEDSFMKYSAKYPMSRREESAYRLKGTRTNDGFRYITTGLISTEALLSKAHEYKCTITAFLTAVMIECVVGIQQTGCKGSKAKPVKITIPVDMRRLFDSHTLRNFALTLNPGIDPRFGDYSLSELCSSISNQLAYEATPQRMSGMIAANVLPQRNLLIRLCPVQLKSIVMDIVYRLSGECNGCLNISNLGNIVMPETFAGHIKRMDFMVGVQRSYPNNCSVLSYGNTTVINMIRNIEESELERRFFSRLVELGLSVDIESNWS